MLRNKKLIIFDMDGTLIDSIGIWNDVDCDLLKQLTGRDHNPSLVQAQREKALRQFRQDPDPYHRYGEFLAEEHHLKESGEAVVTLRYQIAQRHLRSRIDYKPGVPEVLKELKRQGYPMIIASTTKRMNMEVYRAENVNIRSKAPIDEYFSAWYIQEDVTNTKPHPEIYHKILQEWNLTPGDCLIFEDSLVGVEAANNAGIDVIAMEDPYSHRDYEAIAAKSIRQFRDFFQVLDAMKKNG